MKLAEVRTLLKSTTPCWLYGNPVFGFALGKNYEPLIVNMDPVKSGILVFGKAGSIKSPSPVPLEKYSVADQSEILRQLKTMKATGIAGGITSAIIYGSGLINTSKFEGLPPKIGGVGQKELPQLIAFNWTEPEAITGKYDDLQKVSVTDTQLVKNPQVQYAELILIPGPKSLGYGLYIHTSVDAKTRLNLISILEAMRTPNKDLRTALDTDESPEFRVVSPGEMSVIEKSIATYIK